MRKLFPLVLCCVLGSAVAGEPAQWSEAQIEQAALTAQVQICWNQAVPSGYVVVGHTTTAACSGTNYPGERNTRIIKEPSASGEVVCEFPLPTGYVITVDKLSSSACSPVTAGYNAMNVKLAGSQETVCSNSPIPPGYQYGTSIPSGSCRTGFAYNIWK